MSKRDEGEHSSSYNNREGKKETNRRIYLIDVATISGK
jgi:hypothetical protein